MCASPCADTAAARSEVPRCTHGSCTPIETPSAPTASRDEPRPSCPHALHPLPRRRGAARARARAVGTCARSRTRRATHARHAPALEPPAAPERARVAPPSGHGNEARRGQAELHGREEERRGLRGVATRLVVAEPQLPTVVAPPALERARRVAFPRKRARPRAAREQRARVATAGGEGEDGRTATLVPHVRRRRERRWWRRLGRCVRRRRARRRRAGRRRRRKERRRRARRRRGRRARRRRWRWRWRRHWRAARRRWRAWRRRDGWRDWHEVPGACPVEAVRARAPTIVAVERRGRGRSASTSAKLRGEEQPQRERARRARPAAPRRCQATQRHLPPNVELALQRPLFPFSDRFEKLRGE